jgi:hypothetical protein
MRMLWRLQSALIHWTAFVKITTVCSDGDVCVCLWQDMHVFTTLLSWDRSLPMLSRSNIFCHQLTKPVWCSLRKFVSLRNDKIRHCQARKWNLIMCLQWNFVLTGNFKHKMLIKEWGYEITWAVQLIKSSTLLMEEPSYSVTSADLTFPSHRKPGVISADTGSKVRNWISRKWWLPSVHAC